MKFNNLYKNLIFQWDEETVKQANKQNQTDSSEQDSNTGSKKVSSTQITNDNYESELKKYGESLDEDSDLGYSEAIKIYDIKPNDCQLILRKNPDTKKLFFTYVSKQTFNKNSQNLINILSKRVELENNGGENSQNVPANIKSYIRKAAPLLMQCKIWPSQLSRLSNQVTQNGKYHDSVPGDANSADLKKAEKALLKYSNDNNQVVTIGRQKQTAKNGKTAIKTIVRNISFDKFNEKADVYEKVIEQLGNNMKEEVMGMYKQAKENGNKQQANVLMKFLKQIMQMFDMSDATKADAQSQDSQRTDKEVIVDTTNLINQFYETCSTKLYGIGKLLFSNGNWWALKLNKKSTKLSPKLLKGLNGQEIKWDHDQINQETAQDFRNFLKSAINKKAKVKQLMEMLNQLLENSREVGLPDQQFNKFNTIINELKQKQNELNQKMKQAQENQIKKKKEKEESKNKEDGADVTYRKVKSSSGQQKTMTEDDAMRF